MSLYLLKISGSNEVENIFEWDGSGSLTAPSGYVFELYTSGSVTNYSSSTELELFGGSFAGLFTGELSGSILLNGKTFDEVINGTKYGSLVLLSYSGSNIGLVSSSNGFIVSGSNIKMSLNNLEDNKQYKYITTLSSSLSGSLSGSLAGSLLRFTNHDGSDKLEYFINSVEISSSGTSSYANLQVNELHNSIRDAYSTYSASVDIFEDFYYSQWFVDFDLGKTYVGSFSGSFTGSLNGTASHALNFTGVATSALTAISSSYATFAQTASKLEVFTTSSNWTKPSWAKTVKVVCVGGGGGGGGSFGVPSGIVTGGGGGAGGSVSMGEFDANLLPSSSISITVGAGGTGGTGQDSGGSSGGSSMFDTLLIANGGDGGQGGTDNGGSIAYVNGGKSSGTINYLNTGGGPGGRGCVRSNNIDPGYQGVKMCVAPSLPLNKIYVDLNWNLVNVITEKVGVPAAIAPTGGGGGLGYDADNGGNQDGDTTGGSIKTNSMITVGDQNKSLGLVGKEYTYSVDGYVPAFYTKIGLGGKGGNPSASLAPSGGSRYGGGGGGAYGFYSGSYGSFSSGARGANGVVIIISEA